MRSPTGAQNGRLLQAACQVFKKAFNSPPALSCCRKPDIAPAMVVNAERVGRHAVQSVVEMNLEAASSPRGVHDYLR